MIITIIKYTFYLLSFFACCIGIYYLYKYILDNNVIKSL